MSTGSASATPSVEPLHCSQCGAPVPLGDGDVLTCPSCHAEVPVPESYRALRDSVRRDTAERARAEKLYRRFGRPPGWLLCTLADLTGEWKLWVLWVFLGGLLIFPVEYLQRSLSIANQVNLGDILPRWSHALIYGLPPLLAFGTLGWLGGYGTRAANARWVLQSSLAAHPPERPGFPARCRECGAPLAVPARALGVCCPYCHADNLVALPPGVLIDLDDDARRVDKTMADALADERRERRQIALASFARVLVLTGPLMFILLVEVQGHGASPPWIAAASTDPRVIYANQVGLYRTPSTTEVGALDERQISTARSEGDWDVALEAGEHLYVRASDANEGDLRLILQTENMTDPLDWQVEETLADVFLSPGDTWDLEVPWSAWYEFTSYGTGTPRLALSLEPFADR